MLLTLILFCYMTIMQEARGKQSERVTRLKMSDAVCINQIRPKIAVNIQVHVYNVRQYTH